ncbi:MAG: hypothetical protein M0R66_03780 [Candidatus Omnitrophica bacterium]|nr:hypothetical protein [Candidatus Omnitrophota bacterium]
MNGFDEYSWYEERERKERERKWKKKPVFEAHYDVQVKLAKVMDDSCPFYMRDLQARVKELEEKVGT